MSPVDPSRIGGRKFAITLIIFLVTALLTWFGKLDQAVFQMITGWVFTGFVMGNVGEHFIKKNGAVK